MDRNTEEELAERAFQDYYGTDKLASWRSHYGERSLYSYWSASAQEREAVKAELGIAAQEKSAFAKAEELFESIRSSVANSGLAREEARELAGNLLVNAFREEQVRTKDLKEELFWSGTLSNHAEAERANSSYEKPDKFTMDLLEESKLDFAERLQHLIVPITKRVNASDLRPEAVCSRFADWREWMHEILERNEKSEVWDVKEKSHFDGDELDLSVPDDRHQSLSYDGLQSQNSENRTNDSSENVTQLETGSTSSSRVECDIERIVYGDERSDAPGTTEQTRLEDPWSRLHGEERENDERTR